MAINRELSQFAALVNVENDSDNQIGLSTDLTIVGYATVTGSLEAGGLKFPSFDGLKGQVFVTDGQGNIGFTTSNSFYEKRIYVSTTGDDLDDGKTLPVRTIKRAAQIASHATEPVTIVIETGEYIEDNPIIIYDNISIAGDNLRNTIVRPLNAGQDIFRVRNGCYIFGITMKDYVENGIPQSTFNYGISFDNIDDPILSRVGYAGTEVNISNVTFDNLSGIATITTATPHDFRKNLTVRLAGIAFTCDYDGGLTPLTYPESNVSGAIDFPVVSVQSPTEFTIRCGITTVSHYYTSGGTAKIGRTLITQSPYIQNCSVISFLGANGVEVDGSKVISVNEPVLAQEAENPQAGDIPDYGKSIVANAYTMVSFGGVGWRTINDGYAQVVSCFQIFCQDGSLCESGGYLSITNSATNFGTNALRAKGFSSRSYPFDRGLIATNNLEDITQVMKVIGLGRKEQELYVLRIFNSSNQDVTNDFKPVGVAVTFDGVSGVNTSTNYITADNHGLDQGDTVAYYPNVLTPIAGLSSVTQYYVDVLNTNEFRLFKDDSLTVIADLTNTSAGIHSVRKKNVEFFANEVRDTSNNQYQRLTLSGFPSFNFVPGRLVQQNLGAGITAFGHVLDYNSDASTITVSNEVDYLGDRYAFNVTGGAFGTLDDHSGSPQAANIDSTVGLTTYFTLDYTVGSTISGQSIQDFSSLPENYYIHFHRPSIVNSSAHTWEYAGSGNDYNALPQNGGVSDVTKEQVSQKGGRVYSSGTNELGDFKIGDFITAKNRTGNITFSNTVSIGEITSLSFSLGSGVVVNSISVDPGLGDNDPGGPLDSRLATQKATRTFLNDRLGAFIDKDVSSSSIPNRVPLLNASGKLNADLIPPPSPASFYFSSVGGGRTTLVNDIPANNIQPGDIVVENTGVSTISYQLTNDLDSQYLVIGDSTSDYDFTTGVAVTGSSSNAVGIVTIPTSVGYGATGLVKGVIVAGSLTYGGTGYLVPGIYDVDLVTNTGIGVSARALVTVGAGGSVTGVDINFGGRYYAVGDELLISSGISISGTDYATVGITSVQTRLYTKLTDGIKFTTSDTIEDGSLTVVPVIAEVNTSSASTDNYIVLSTTNIDASNIISGTVSPSRLGSGSASSDTFLSGDSSYQKVITAVGIATTEPINITSSAGFDNSTPGFTTYYGRLNLSLGRADDLTVPSNDYGNLGIARFKKSTFSIGPNGAIRIKSTAEAGDVDAATLGGNPGSFYLDQNNFTTVTPITKGGTGLSALPADGALLVGNGSVYNLTVNPTIGGNITANSFNGSLIGNLTAGFSTITNLDVTNLDVTNINATTGVSTISGVQIVSGIITATTGNYTNLQSTYFDATGIGTISKLISTNSTSTYSNVTGIGTVTNLNATYANVTGVGTVTNLNATNATITGVSTIANFQMTPVGVGATVGGNDITYYGNGAQLTGIDATKIINGTSEMAIGSAGGNISATVSGQNIFNVSTTGLAMVAGERFDVSSYSENVHFMGGVSGTRTLDLGTYSIFVADISGTTSVTFTLSGAASGRLSSGLLILRFSGTGTRNVSLAMNPKFAGGASPTWTTTAATDIISFFTPDAGSTTYISVVGQGFA